MVMTSLQDAFIYIRHPRLPHVFFLLALWGRFIICIFATGTSNAFIIGDRTNNINSGPTPWLHIFCIMVMRFHPKKMALGSTHFCRHLPAKCFPGGFTVHIHAIQFGAFLIFIPDTNILPWLAHPIRSWSNWRWTWLAILLAQIIKMVERDV